MRLQTGDHKTLLEKLLGATSRSGRLQSRLFVQLKRVSERLGIRVIPISESMFDMEEEFNSLYKSCRAYTESTPERMYALYKAVEHVVHSGIGGDLVECGVWRGGSCMLMAMTLMLHRDTSRRIYLYDTFTGMTSPTEKDFFLKDGRKALDMWKGSGDAVQSRWLAVPMEEVRENILSTGFPEERLVFVKGRVEDTIPGVVPRGVSVLRLDTDWYASTIHELTHLYPLLADGGVLLVDDYGVWAGAREAVDEYFARQGIRMLLNRIDYTGRIGVKPCRGEPRDGSADVPD